MTNIWILYAGCVCLSALVILLARNRLKLFSEYEKLKAFVATPLFWLAFAVTALLLPSVVLSSYRFFEITAGFSHFENVTDQTAAIRNLGLVLAAFVGVPFVVWRSFVAQKQVDVSEQGQITDRINKAVEGLGTEKLVKRDGKETSEPNIEVRIGAIYALERIAQDSDRDHVQIMEILCAYIRENAPATEAKDWSKFELQIGEEDGPLRSDWHEQWEAFELLQQHKIEQQKRPRADVQTALTVIGRRSARQRQLEARAHDPNCNNEFVFDIPAPKPEEFFNPRVSEMVQLSEFLDALRDWETQLQSYRGSRLDLRETDLRRADFYGLNFGGADFRFSQMQGAVFFQTQLRGAALLRTGLSWASFSEAQMQAAQLDRAQMQGTRLDAAYMQAALFNEAQMQGADLKDAKLQGASFSDAQMQGAKLGGAQMQGAQLCDTQMQNVRLINIQINEHTSLTLSKLVGACVRYFDDVTITQLKPFWAEMFGDATALPPEAEGRPAHWPDFKMENEEFLGEWRKWQADPDTYCPPKRPKAENDKPTTT